MTAATRTKRSGEVLGQIVDVRRHDAAEVVATRIGHRELTNALWRLAGSKE